jgi:hypothetical protein
MAKNMPKLSQFIRLYDTLFLSRYTAKKLSSINLGVLSDWGG